MDEYAEAIARREAGEPPLKPNAEPEMLGLHYPLNYVLETFDLWYRSGFVWYPNGQPYDDQDPQLLADYHYVLSLFDNHYREIIARRGDRP